MSKLYNGEVNINIGDSKNGKVVRVYTECKPGMETYSNEGNLIFETYSSSTFPDGKFRNLF